MAVHNEEAYIVESVKSVLCGSSDDVELILVDDGSNDRTASLVEAMVNQYPTLRVLRPGKIGKCAAFNLGVSCASGAWIGLFAGDDIFNNQFIKSTENIRAQYDPFVDKVLIGGLQRYFSTEKEFNRFNGIINQSCSKDSPFANTVGIISVALTRIVFPVPTSYPNEDGWTALCYRYLSDYIIESGVVYNNYRIHSGNSINQNAPFEKFNQSYHQRRVVLNEFNKVHGNQLSENQLRILQSLARMEELRYRGNYIRILMEYPAPFSEKLKSIGQSTRFFYFLKQKLIKIVLGRNQLKTRFLNILQKNSLQ